MKKQLLCTNSTLLKKFRLLLGVAFALFSYSSAFAQENNMITFIKTQQAVDENSELGSLLYDSQPTIFIHTNSTSQRGDGNFQVVECSPSQISQLYEENHLFANAKLIKIKIKSPWNETKLDLSKLQSFGLLQYIEFIYEYNPCDDNTDECLLTLVKNSIIQANIPLTILYTLSNP